MIVRLLLELAAEAVDRSLQADREDAAEDRDAAKYHARDRLLLRRAVLDDPVMARDVADLVREHRGELIFVLEPREHAGVHIDVPVRERKRVRRRVAQHVELVLDIVVGRHRPYLVTDAAHEAEHLVVVVEQRVRFEVVVQLLRRVDQGLLVVVDANGAIVAAGECGERRRREQRGEKETSRS